MGLFLCTGLLWAQEPLPSRYERRNPPAADEVRVTSMGPQEREGSKYRLRRSVVIETSDMRLEADEVDYDEETGDSEARGNVHFTHFARHELVDADRVEYNVSDETGKFYNVHGSAPAKIEAKPGILTTNNPFSFTCEWAERTKEKYICHDGTVTNCKLPNPWWTLRGPRFDIIPGDYALARRSLFWLRGMPLFYAPYFYKSLKRAPRKSGFLTPNIANSSRRGKIFGGGYYWAINRSYDATYRAQLWTLRGIAHQVDFRGKPTDKSAFNFNLYGVNDRLGRPDDPTVKEGGYILSFEGRSALPKGFEGRAAINYLSSFRFRQAFTESFYESIFSQVQSIGYATKHWSSFGFTGLFQSTDNFLSAEPRDKISIRKLPSAEFTSREREISERVLPIWVSFDSSLSLLRRNQLAFQTRRFVERVDANPRITTQLHWKDFRVTPTFSVRSTHWGSSLDDSGKLSGEGLWRNSSDVSVDLGMPSFARVYDVKGKFGPKLKHVIEPHANYTYVTGVSDFKRTIRFDETELLTNTNQAEFGITQHLYRKHDGTVDEILSWDVTQQRYFNPSFGNAIVPGTPTVILTGAELTGLTYFDRPRTYSPLVSTLRFYPPGPMNFEWRADYDPVRGGFANSSLQGYVKIAKYSVSVGHNQLRTPWAKANQMTGMVGWGQDNRKGWSAAVMSVYDYRVNTLVFANTQVTYNTDCCGFSLQMRRWDFGFRQETQFYGALVISNIGSFGTLKRQERIF